MNRSLGWGIAGGVVTGLIVLAVLYVAVWAPGRTGTTLTPPSRTPIVATPSTSPTTLPSASSARTPTPTFVPKPASSTAPASSGKLPNGFRLLHEGVGPEGDTSAWQPATWQFDCGTGPHVFKAFSSLEASRHIRAEGPEWVGTETVLVFATESAATAFVNELRTVHESCDMTAYDATSRMRTASAAFSGSWDTGFGLTSWDEAVQDGKTWATVPGGSLDLVVRRGRAVAMASQAGEIMGDAMQTPTLVSDTRQAIDHAVPLLCSYTSRGC